MALLQTNIGVHVELETQPENRSPGRGCVIDLMPTSESVNN